MQKLMRGQVYNLSKQIAMMGDRLYNVFLVGFLMCCVDINCFDITEDICPGKVYANKNCSNTSMNKHAQMMVPAWPIWPCEDCLNCSLYSDDNMKEHFSKTLQKKPYFIFLQLDFNDPPFNDTDFQYLSHTYNHIDPLLWFWAHGEKGRFLLHLPTTFQAMSLGSLTPGVYTAYLNISMESCPHFNKLCDNDKLEVLAQHIFNVTEEVASSCSEDSLQFDEDTMVCQDKAVDVFGRAFNNFLATHGFDYLVMYQSETECWNFNGQPLGAVVSPYWFLKTALIFAIFILMSYPLCTLSLIRTNLPTPVVKAIQTPRPNRNNQIIIFIGKHMEIGVGIKHLLLHMTTTPVRIMRGILCLSILVLIIYPGITVRNIFDDSNVSFKRWQAFFRMDYVNCVLYTCLEQIPLVIALWGCFEVFYLRNGKHYLENILKNNPMEKKWPVINLSIFTHENSETRFDDSCGMIRETGVPRDFAMRQLNTVLDWRQFKIPYHNIIQYWENKSRYVGIVLCVCYYIIFLPPMWIMSFPGLDPLRRLIVRVFQVLFNLLRSFATFAKWVYSDTMSLKDELKKLWPYGVDDILNIIRLGVLFNFSLRFLAFVYLLAEVAVHILSGIVLNSGTVTANFILVIFLIGFTYETITSIPDTYYALLCTMIDIVFEMIDEQTLIGFIPAELWHRDTSGQNLIAEQFFWDIADICKPLRIVVVDAMMKIFLVGLGIGTTVSLLNQVHTNEGNWPDLLTNIIFFVSVVILPKLFEMMGSKVDKRRQNEILCSQIRKEITRYVEHMQELCAIQLKTIRQTSTDNDSIDNDEETKLDTTAQNYGTISQNS
ncbi:uncharacterized protein [Amphiura filiformis]|uniref:uncharacterized protein n=1 Tax=Amphiura filiformis TaxID=82378 RepID=UPI003B21157C